MAVSKSEVRGTVTGRMYRELPEGHRTTFVVGMLDMLGVAYLYVAPEHKPRIDAVLRYVIGYENDALRQRFDGYMNAGDERQTLGAAGCFLTALNEWCGFDDPKGGSSEGWFKRLLG
ncbi:MAG: hypothetical protein WDM91_22325 [Rhizomicrobium sp.]